MFKSFLIICAFISLPATASELGDAFRRETKLQEGDYRLVDGRQASPLCIEGDLLINDRGEVLSVRVGANVLLDGITAKGERVLDEGEFKYKWKTSFQNRHVKVDKRVNGTISARWTTDLTVQPNGISYTRTQQGQTFTCVLERR